MHNAVGPTGAIYGIDLSKGMLREAKALRARYGWHNVSLAQGDSANFTAPELLDGVLFSLSFNTMPHHMDVLRQAWKQLRPGGRLVIMDAKLPGGPGDKPHPAVQRLADENTLLGNPHTVRGKALGKSPATFVMEEFLFGSYFICRAVKP
ncbi:MAG: methyltransferase domain-containing protein [Pseudolabrys sp.]